MRRAVLLLALALVVACGLRAAPLAAGDPPFVAVLEPAGAPRGVVIGIHGGAWYGVGRRISLDVRDDLERWRRAGWLALVVDYPPGGAAQASVLATYDKVRARDGGRLPVCLYGESAGAQLALMIAARRADVACVETAGAPTDLAAIDPHASARAARADRNARMAFPGAALRSESPLRNARRIRAPLLLAHLRTDPVVGVAHSRRMAAAVRGARLLELAPGPVPWVHGSVARSSFAALARAENALRAELRL